MPKMIVRPLKTPPTSEIKFKIVSNRLSDFVTSSSKTISMLVKMKSSLGIQCYEFFTLRYS